MLVSLIFLAVIVPSHVVLSTVSAVANNTVRTPISGMLKSFCFKKYREGSPYGLSSQLKKKKGQWHTGNFNSHDKQIIAL